MTLKKKIIPIQKSKRRNRRIKSIVYCHRNASSQSYFPATNKENLSYMYEITTRKPKREPNSRDTHKKNEWHNKTAVIRQKKLCEFNRISRI